jgi:hypothetical protein
MGKLSFVVLFVLCASACAAAPEASSTSPEPSTLCQVVADPAAFDGQEVTVRGIFASDYQHYSSLSDPDCPRGLSPYSAPGRIGEALLNRALCSEAGGLVEITARGRVEARPGEIPAVKFWVLEYSDARAIAFDPTWEDEFGVLASESRESWNGRRRRLCFVAGYLDPETMQRREPPQ